jgi:hypothetical protein
VTVRDGLGVVGFGALFAGVVMVAGLGWGLVVGGTLLTLAAVVGEWKRSKP